MSWEIADGTYFNIWTNRKLKALYEIDRLVIENGIKSGLVVTRRIEFSAAEAAEFIRYWIMNTDLSGSWDPRLFLFKRLVGAESTPESSWSTQGKFDGDIYRGLMGRCLPTTLFEISAGGVCLHPQHVPVEWLNGVSTASELVFDDEDMAFFSEIALTRFAETREFSLLRAEFLKMKVVDGFNSGGKRIQLAPAETSNRRYCV